MERKEKLAYALAQKVASSIEEQVQIGQKILSGNAQDLMSWFADRVNNENQYNQESGSMLIVEAMRDAHNSDIMEHVENGIEFAGDITPFEFSYVNPYIEAARELFNENDAPINTILVKEAFSITQAHAIAEHATAKNVIDGEDPDYVKVTADVDVKQLMQELSRELYNDGNKLTSLLTEADMSDLRYSMHRGLVSELSNSGIEFDAEKTWGHLDKYEAFGGLHMPYEGMEGFDPEQPFAIYRDMTEEEIDMLYAIDLTDEERENIIGRGEVVNEQSAHGFAYRMEMQIETQDVAEHEKQEDIEVEAPVL